MDGSSGEHDYRFALRLSDEEWFEFLAGQRSVDGLEAPPMPEPELQQALVGSSGIDAIREAGAFYSRVIATLGGPNVAEDIGRVLDFGCGWGRIYRLFLRNCDEGSLVGVDIESSCVELCRAAMPYGVFALCDVNPPLPFPDATFDVVTAYSVFSHLPEPIFRSWVREFSRILTTDGKLCFTTLKDVHIDVWQSRTRDPYYGKALAAAGFRARRWRRRASKGELLFVPTGGGGELMVPDVYGEAILPRAYVMREAAGLGFRCLDYSSAEDLPQAFVALAKEPA